MQLSPADWHARFSQQARWTQAMRRNLYARAGLAQARRILEVGCGTGALLDELEQITSAAILGLDINPTYLAHAADHSNALLAQGDAHFLPFADASFDLCLCHFVLLWVSNPAQVIAEMRRVARPGANVLALAEPDYGGRIDFPPELAALGRLQADALRRQGADPWLGRKLGSLFAKAGLLVREMGVLGGQWSGLPDLQEWELEWQTLEADLEDSISEDQLKQLRALDAASWQLGARVLFVPTFYAWGVVATSPAPPPQSDHLQPAPGMPEYLPPPAS